MHATTTQQIEVGKDAPRVQYRTETVFQDLGMREHLTVQ